MTTTAGQEFASVWDALADTPEEAANLGLRSAIMRDVLESLFLIKSSNE